MARSKDKGGTEVNAGSMADIAFLLLIFFLVTTQIATNKGLTLLLPPKQEDDEPLEVKQQQRNIFKILVNSKDKILIEDDMVIDDVSEIRGMVYDFVLNFGSPGDVKKGRAKVSDRETYAALPPAMRAYVNSNLGSSDSSDGPSAAIVSLKADRGSSYEIFIQILDELNAAYNRIYGERVGLTDEEFRKLKRTDPRQKALYDEARSGIPKAISIAEPSKVGG
jgi:biopolymer transport protein ExbD